MSVRILDNFATGRRSNLQGLREDAEVIEGDIQSYERVNRAIIGCDAVLHQAALPSIPRSIQDPLTSNATNVIGTLNVLLAARDHDVRRVVVASSSSVYGTSPELPKREDQPAMPISPYSTAKLASENYARSFHAVYGLETVVLRYFNVFGPRQDPMSDYAAVIPRFVSRLAAGEPAVIYGDGEQSRDFTYVSNVVSANLLALKVRGAAGRVYNIASGRRITINELYAEIGKVTGCEIPPAYAAPRPGEVRNSHGDISLAQDELGYVVEVGLGEGLRRTAEALLQDSAAYPSGLPER